MYVYIYIYIYIYIKIYLLIFILRRYGKNGCEMEKSLRYNGVFKIISFESRNNLSSVITEILLNYIYRDGLSSRVSCRDTFSPL